MVQANAASSPARAPRPSAAASVNSAPVPGVTQMTSAVRRNDQDTSVRLLGSEARVRTQSTA